MRLGRDCRVYMKSGRLEYLRGTRKTGYAVWERHLLEKSLDCIVRNNPWSVVVSIEEICLIGEADERGGYGPVLVKVKTM